MDLANNPAVNSMIVRSPAKSLVPVTGWGTLADNVYPLPVPCKGALLKLTSAGTEGDLMVHLVNDPSNQFYPLPLVKGVPIGAIFDKVTTTGTTGTITLADVYLHPLNDNA